jgi:hypothetical protein
MEGVAVPCTAGGEVREDGALNSLFVPIHCTDCSGCARMLRGIRTRCSVVPWETRCLTWAYRPRPSCRRRRGGRPSSWRLPMAGA